MRNEHRSGLRHGFHDQYAGHDRTIREMPGELRLVERDVLHRGDVATGTTFEFADLVDQEKRVTPGAHFHQQRGCNQTFFGISHTSSLTHDQATIDDQGLADDVAR